jgi:hypothetical protein
MRSPSQTSRWLLFSLGLAAALFAVRAVRGRSTPGHHDWQDRYVDPVQIESDDSFPASDPPSHTPMTGATVRPPGIH